MFWSGWAETFTKSQFESVPVLLCTPAVKTALGAQLVTMQLELLNGPGSQKGGPCAGRSRSS